MALILKLMRGSALSNCSISYYIHGVAYFNSKPIITVISHWHCTHESSTHDMSHNKFITLWCFFDDNSSLGRSGLWVASTFGEFTGSSAFVGTRLKKQTLWGSIPVIDRYRTVGLSSLSYRVATVKPKSLTGCWGQIWRLRLRCIRSSIINY